jgi:hypothetical protein
MYGFKKIIVKCMYVCVYVKDLPAQRAAAAKLVNNRYYSDEKKKSFK